MRVFVVHNPTARIKGHLRALGVEVSTNVFVFDASAEVASKVWTQITTLGVSTPGFRVVLIEPSTGKPGFTTKGFGDNANKTLEVDGIPLRFRPTRKS